MFDQTMSHMGGAWGFHGLGILWMVLFWALVIAAVVFLVKAIVGNGGPARGSDRNRSLEILEERYAKGEIGQEEFEDKRRTLQGRD